MYIVAMLIEIFR